MIPGCPKMFVCFELADVDIRLVARDVAAEAVCCMNRLLAGVVEGHLIQPKPVHP